MLDGGSGQDTLDGADGTNVLTGGAGSDTFVFDDMSGQDTISDFECSVDKIDLSQLFGNASDASAIVGGTGTSWTSCFGEADYSSIGLMLQDDADGTIVTLVSQNENETVEAQILLAGTSIDELSMDDFIF